MARGFRHAEMLTAIQKKEDAKLAEESALNGDEKVVGSLDLLVGVVGHNTSAIAAVDGRGKIDLDGGHLVCSCWFCA